MKRISKTKGLHIMPGKYVRVWNKPGTAHLYVSISEDGYPSSEKTVEMGLEPTDAKNIAIDYISNGYLLYDNFVSGLRGIKPDGKKDGISSVKFSQMMML